MIKSAAELFKVAALRTRTIKVRDADVTIRELSVRARQAFLDAVKEGPAQSGAWLVQNALVNEKGELFLTAEDAAALADASPEVVDSIASAVLGISGLLATEKKA